ncbi:MAG: GTPase [Phycisphaerales bacterium]
MTRAKSDHSAPAYAWLSPAAASRSAAISVLRIVGDPQAVFAALSIRAVAPGEARLRDLGGIDAAVVARTSSGEVFITPHGGVAVRRAVSNWLEARGVRAAPADAPASTIFPEAGSDLEARMLRTLARAASPLAIDLLLDQPRRWRTLGIESASDADRLPEDQLSEIRSRSARLKRLVVPAMVVAIGPPNIGKSTLLNTLARRSVSIVADEPGTTRDHVGVYLDVCGVVVNYIDAPGIGTASSDIDRDAQRISLEVAARADVLVLCADPTTDFIDVGSSATTLRVSLRSDLGAPRGGSEVAVSAARGEGIEVLVSRLAEAAVPRAALEHPGPWAFWEAGAA